jgi:putative acetyltransferase
MTERPHKTIRLARAHDGGAIFQVHGAAFPTPAEARIAAALDATGQSLVSVVAVADDAMVGHVLFSRMHVGETPAVALAPVAVQPEHQSQGHGSALIEEGLRLCRARGERIVLVLGDPAYYRRFGFAEAPAAIERPWPGPNFMALELVPGALDGVVGRVRYPVAFGVN